MIRLIHCPEYVLQIVGDHKIPKGSLFHWNSNNIFEIFHMLAPLLIKAPKERQDTSIVRQGYVSNTTNKTEV